MTAVTVGRPLTSEADMLRTLQAGCYALADLYTLAEEHGLADRPGGRKRIQDGKEQYKRRVRSALMTLQRQGRARPSGERGAWLIEGTADRPRRALLVWLPSDPSQVELVLGEAWDVLARCDEPIDLIVADPPWALGRDRADAHAIYQRDASLIVGGYVDVDPAEYAEFTARWIAATVPVLRPGGYLAVVTGPQQSARVQIEAESAGLTYVNSIAAPKPFGKATTRRYVHGHRRVTLLTKGRLDSTRRVFHQPPEMPRGRSGDITATDVWADIPVEHRGGLLRYDNSLPVALVSRVVRSTTDVGDLVADPFVGGGTTVVACMTTGRRCYGGDVNPKALQFTMARILAEVGPGLGVPAPRVDDAACQVALW